MDREKASQSFLGAPGLTTRRTRIYPIEGDQNTEQTILMTGPPPTRDRGGKEDRRRPGQRQVPPRQGPDRPLRPRPGPGRITPIYLPPNAPDPGPHGTRTGRRQEPASPTPARSPRRKPSRPSPPTSPTAPSTTTSSTSQPHNHTTILFNSGHSLLFTILCCPIGIITCFAGARMFNGRPVSVSCSLAVAEAFGVYALRQIIRTFVQITIFPNREDLLYQLYRMAYTGSL